MESFLERGQAWQLPEGQILFQDGQPYQTGYIDVSYIMNGEICYAKRSKQGQFVQVKLTKNDVIGVEAMYSGVYPVTGLTADHTELYQWPKDEFELLVGKDIEFAVRVITSLSRHLRLINREFMLRETKMEQDVKDSKETLMKAGRAHFTEGNDSEAKKYFERILSEYPDEYTDEIVKNLNEINARLSQRAQAFDVKDQQGVDSDMTIQYGLYNLAFQGKDNVSDDLQQKFGKTYAPGTVIFHEGDHGEELYILLKGNVQVIKDNKALFNLKDGDIFGEMAIFEDKPRSATIKALTESSALALTKDNFKMIFQLHPTWALQLISSFGSRISNCYHLLSGH